MSKHYRISTNQVRIRHDFERKGIKYLAPLPDQRAFIVYSSQETNDDDTYLIANFINGEVISSGQFCQKPERIENLNDDLIVIVDGANQKLRVFSIEKEDYLNIADIQVPSQQALPLNQRTIEQIGDAITDLNILLFPSSKSVVLIEKKQQSNQNYVDFIMTAYCFDEEYLATNGGESRIAQLSINQSNLNKVYGQLNNQDTLIITSQQFQDTQQSKFSMWNFRDKVQQKQLQHIQLTSNVDGTVINITPWQKPSEIAFWLNGKPGKPQIVIYDYIQKIDYEHTLKVYPSFFIVVNVYEVNFERERIILNLIPETQNSCIDIINPIKNTVTYTQDIDTSQDFIRFSSDSRYFVTCENNYDVIGEDCSESSKESILTIHSVIGIKTSLMNFLQKKNLISKYGEEASKAIIDMLTDEDSETMNK